MADLFALALVCGDGHRFDVFTKWAGIEKLVRPMLLGLQDVYSRKILAWRIGLNENAALVRLAFADLLRDWGVPQAVLLDNGRAFARKWRGHWQPLPLQNQARGAQGIVHRFRLPNPLGAALSRPRQGQGGGREYHISPFHGTKRTCSLAGGGQRPTSPW